MIPRTVYLLTALIAISTLPGCGWVNSWLRGTDNALPPSPLQPIQASLTPANLWQRNLSSGTGAGFVKLQPARAGESLFIAGYKGDVTAVNRVTGQTLWRTDTDRTLSAGVGLGDGLVLLGTMDGEVLALDQSDGQELWRANVPSEVLASPRSGRGVVVVRTIDGNLTGLDARTGERLWGYTHTVPVLSLRGTSAPLITDDLVLLGLDSGRLLILSLVNGRPLGEQMISPPRGRTEMDRMVDIDADPQLSGDVLFVVSYQGQVSALDLRAGNILWRRDLSSYTGLAVDSSQVYVSDTEGTLWALERASGRALWQQPDLKGRRLSAPVTAGNSVVVGDFEGYLHWLDKSSGRIIGRMRADNTAIRITPLTDGRTLYVYSDGGEFSAVRAQP